MTAMSLSSAIRGHSCYGPRSSSTKQLVLKLMSNVGFTHVMLIFEVCRMQPLFVQGSFHSDFRGRPGGPGSMLMERTTHEAVRVKLTEVEVTGM